MAATECSHRSGTRQAPLKCLMTHPWGNFLWDLGNLLIPDNLSFFRVLWASGYGRSVGYQVLWRYECWRQERRESPLLTLLEGVILLRTLFLSSRNDRFHFCWRHHWHFYFATSDSTNSTRVGQYSGPTVKPPWPKGMRMEWYSQYMNTTVYLFSAIGIMWTSLPLLPIG